MITTEAMVTDVADEGAPSCSRYGWHGRNGWRRRHDVIFCCYLQARKTPYLSNMGFFSVFLKITWYQAYFMR